MAHMKHSGGIVDTILELGFDAVKYFEITANGTSQRLSISPPARRLTLRNADDPNTGNSFYFNVVDDTATASANSTPGNNLKLRPGCVFEMDFDSLTSIAFITEGASVPVEGYLGWKGTQAGC